MSLCHLSVSISVMFPVNIQKAVGKTSCNRVLHLICLNVLLLGFNILLFSVLKYFSAHLEELEQLLKGIAMMKELTPRTSDYLVSFGECMSTRLFAAYLNKLGVKARQVGFNFHVLLPFGDLKYTLFFYYVHL